MNVAKQIKIKTHVKKPDRAKDSKMQTKKSERLQKPRTSNGREMTAKVIVLVIVLIIKLVSASIKTLFVILVEENKLVVKIKIITLAIIETSLLNTKHYLI